MKFLKFYFVALLSVILSMGGLAQENYFDSLLLEKVKVANPVYKPVVGIGYGVLNFFGDVNNNFKLLSTGTPGGRITVSTYMDKKHFFKLDFYLLRGILGGSERTLERNLNFRSNITSLGIQIHYDFAQFINQEKIGVSPYVELGVGTLSFNSKGDLKDGNGNLYNYAADGTIRNNFGELVQRDYKYETDLRSLDLYGMGMYSQFGVVFPVGIGFNAHLSDRVTLRVGTSLNISTTDLIDNVSYKGVGITANRLTDAFTFSFVSLHLDLFSEPEYMKVDKMFVDFGNDDVITGDEDYDLILDFADQCPVTPYGVETDSTGCAIDSDMDGVPDYLDKEMNTPALALVDNEGKEISDSLLYKMLQPGMAEVHSNADRYFQAARATDLRVMNRVKAVPLKFKTFDLNNDNYLSFQEFLKAIDAYFDYKTLLSMQDIYLLMDFYFNQE